MEWQPRSLEDRLLYNYWLKHQGRLYLEVPIGGVAGRGNWPEGSKIRRIDAVRLNDVQEDEYSVLSSKAYTEEEFYEFTRGQIVELIEVKKNLSRYVIGQVIAGVDMMERQYALKEIIPVILCKEGDPALEWVCEKRGIVVKIAEDS